MKEQHEKQLFRIFRYINVDLGSNEDPLIDIKNTLFKNFNDKTSSILINNLKYRKGQNNIIDEDSKYVSFYAKTFVTSDDIYHQFYISYHIKLCWELYIADKGLTK